MDVAPLWQAVLIQAIKDALLVDKSLPVRDVFAAREFLLGHTGSVDRVADMAGFDPAVVRRCADRLAAANWQPVEFALA